MQIVNNYQSLTIATKTHIPGVTERVEPLLNLTVIKKTHLIGNLHVADSLVVLQSLKMQFLGIQFLIFDLKSSTDLYLRSLGELLQTLPSKEDAVSVPYLIE